eukprot:UN00299
MIVVICRAIIPFPPVRIINIFKMFLTYRYILNHRPTTKVQALVNYL